jgi:hypothetical protein
VEEDGQDEANDNKKMRDIMNMDEEDMNQYELYMEQE